MAGLEKLMTQVRQIWQKALKRAKGEFKIENKAIVFRVRKIKAGAGQIFQRLS